MKQPEFWFRPPGWFSTLLLPIAALWGAATRYRLRRGRRTRTGTPVICIGNLNVGGAGKTPMAMAMAQHLVALGETPHFVTRGHGGSLRGPARVDPGQHRADDVGDEALLLAAFAPTWVCRQRQAGASLATDAGASVIILDDGHQDASIHHDLSIVVVDTGRGFGNERVLPAGPLREPVAAGLRRAHLVVAIGYGMPGEFRRRWLPGSDLPVAAGTMTPLRTGIDWKGERVLAFAGIGDPAKFFASLEALGAHLVKAVPLGDHQPLTGRLLSRLESAARAASAKLVTTEKDAVRLNDQWRSHVLTLPVRLELEDWSDIDALLAATGISPAAAA